MIRPFSILDQLKSSPARSLSTLDNLPPFNQKRRPIGHRLAREAEVEKEGTTYPPLCPQSLSRDRRKNIGIQVGPLVLMSPRGPLVG